MAERRIRKRCRHCGGWLDAAMIQSARLEWGDGSTDVFSRTLACFRCPKCDTVPQPGVVALFVPWGTPRWG
jgi:hypothetical protein